MPLAWQLWNKSRHFQSWCWNNQSRQGLCTLWLILVRLTMNSYECPNRARAEKGGYFYARHILLVYPGPACLKLNLLSSYLCKAVSLSYLLWPHSILWILDWTVFSTGNKLLIWKHHFSISAHLSLPLLTHQSNSLYVCLSIPISTKLWDSLAPILAFCIFLSGNSFNLLLSDLNPQSCIETFLKVLLIIKWMQCEEATWPEELGVKSSGLLI